MTSFELNELKVGDVCDLFFTKNNFVESGCMVEEITDTEVIFISLSSGKAIIWVRKEDMEVSRENIIAH